MTPETIDKLLGVLDSQERMNDAVTRGLESLFLQAERYDAELAALRAELRQVRVTLDGIMQTEHYRDLNSHSVRVALLEEGEKDA